jgi:hypothetical protein
MLTYCVTLRLFGKQYWHYDFLSAAELTKFIAERSSPPWGFFWLEVKTLKLG